MAQKRKKIEKTKHGNKYIKLIRYLWLIFIFVVIFVPIYVYSVQFDFLGLFGSFPNRQLLENPEQDLSSELYSVDNQLLGKYFTSNRTLVDYDQLSPNLIRALEVTEDIRFESHSGIDLRSLIRVVLRFGRAGGGSTITQQLAKLLFGTRSEEYKGLLSDISGLGIIISKTKEMILAVQLEESYTKQEIMAMYLNTIEYGYNSNGIQAASRTFFNTTPDSLSIQDAAMIVGILNRPSFYNPRKHPERALRKRTEILYNLHKYGFFERSNYDSINALPLGLHFQTINQNEGLAPYFRKVAGNWLRQWAIDNGYDLYRDGLKIYTTIDSKLQTYAEESVTEHMKELQKHFDEHWKGKNPWIDERWREIRNFIDIRKKKTPQYKAFVAQYGEDSDSVDIMMNTPTRLSVFSWDGDIDTLMSPIDSLKYYKRFLQTGFMAMDPHTGEVKAWVGGIDHKYFKYDHVKQGKRQPGSTFKPFVYTAAIENGFTPCYEARDVKISFEVVGDPPIWSPENANGKYTGATMTLRQGLARSVNSITAFLMKNVTPETVVKYAHNMGIQSKLDPVPSLCLGVSDVSLIELVGAYSTLVNKGFNNKPFFISRIEDKNGNIIQEFTTSSTEAIKEETAYIMLYMLRGGAEEQGGTSMGLSRELRIDNQIAAKTGTTNNASDGWYMGLTKDLVAGAWVGGDERSIHYRNWALGSGARTALPIWDKFMTLVYADSTLGYEKGPFPKPATRLSIELDCDKYRKAYESIIIQGDDTIHIDEEDHSISEEDIL